MVALLVTVGAWRRATKMAICEHTHGHEHQNTRNRRGEKRKARRLVFNPPPRPLLSPVDGPVSFGEQPGVSADMRLTDLDHHATKIAVSLFRCMRQGERNTQRERQTHHNTIGIATASRTGRQ